MLTFTSFLPFGSIMRMIIETFGVDPSEVLATISTSLGK
jgi:hypothetical protein